MDSTLLQEAPSLFFATRLPDSSERETLFNKTKSLVSKLGKETDAEMVQTPIPGGILQGIKINYLNSYLAVTKQTKKSLLDKLGKKRSERLIKALEGKSIFILTGSANDTVFLQCSPTSQAFALAKNHSNSILTSSHFDILRENPSSPPKLLFFASQDALGEIAKNFHPLSSIAKGVRRATSAASSSPQRQKLERALDKLADREAALVERYFMRDAAGWVLSKENDYSFQMTGGPDLPFLNIIQQTEKKLQNLNEINIKDGFSFQAFIDPEGLWHMTSLASSLLECLWLSGKETQSLPWSNWASRFSKDQEPNSQAIDKHTFSLLNCLSSTLALSFKKPDQPNENLQGWLMAGISNASTIQSSGPGLLTHLAAILQATYPSLGNLIPKEKTTQSSEEEFLYWQSVKQDEGNAALSANTLLLGSPQTPSRSLIADSQKEKSESSLLKISFPIKSTSSSSSLLNMEISTSGPLMYWQGSIQHLTHEN